MVEAGQYACRADHVIAGRIFGRVLEFKAIKKLAPQRTQRHTELDA